MSIPIPLPLLADVSTEIGKHWSIGPNPKAGALVGNVLHLDTMLSTLLVALVLFALAFFVRRKLTSDVPGGLQNFVEFVLEFVIDTAKGQIGEERARVIAPLAFTLALFVFLSNMVGLKNDGGDPNAPDPVDRVSARAQAVVSLFAQSSFEFVPLNADVHRFLDPLIAQKGLKAAIREASPITYVSPDDPPFLEILGDQDEYIPFAEAVNLQTALHKAGVRCDVIKIPGGKHGTGGWNKIPGVPDWEREMTEWLNARLHHQGPIGEGIRARVATAAQ